MHRAKILDRYIFRELLSPFFLSMATLTFVLFLQKMFRLAELVVSKGATIEATARLLVYLMPNFLVVTIPMSLLIASIAAFARLTSDSEVTAMKASRVSLYRMLRPVAALSLAAFLVTAVTSLVLLPGANYALKAHLFNMVKARSTVGIEPGVFTSTFDGMVIYVDRMKSFDDMEGVFISDERSAKDPYAIVARRGKLIADPETLHVTLAMQNGAIHPLPQDEGSYTLIGFNSGRLYLDINNALLPKSQQERKYNEISTPELLRELNRAKTEGKPSGPLESELHTRLSIPVVCLFIGLMGAPLGIRRSRSGKSASIAIALVIFFIYYVILAGSRNLAEAGALAPAVAYWIPNALMAAATAVLIYMKGHELDFGIIDRIVERYRRILTWLIKS